MVELVIPMPEGRSAGRSAHRRQRIRPRAARCGRGEMVRAALGFAGARAVLIVGRCGRFKIVIAEYVRREVERNLLDLLPVNESLATEAIDAYCE